MGTRGPVPKRTEQRRRRNQPEQPVEKVEGAVPPPELDLPGAHPLAVALFEAIKESPEAGYFTPAVWQRARVSAHALSQQLYADRMSAGMYTQLQADWKSMLIDPGELRRLGIEVAKAERVDSDELAAVSALDELRAARAAG